MIEKIIFMDDYHRRFYEKIVEITKTQKDAERKSLFYCLGICPETREHIGSLYSFDENCIKLDGLSEGWQTSTTIRICRLAFNLYNGFHHTGFMWETLESCSDVSFTPYDLFCGSYALYMLEAVKIRFEIIPVQDVLKALSAFADQKEVG